MATKRTLRRMHERTPPPLRLLSRQWESAYWVIVPFIVNDRVCIYPFPPPRVGCDKENFKTRSWFEFRVVLITDLFLNQGWRTPSVPQLAHCRERTDEQFDSFPRGISVKCNANNLDQDLNLGGRFHFHKPSNRFLTSHAFFCIKSSVLPSIVQSPQRDTFKK